MTVQVQKELGRKPKSKADQKIPVHVLEVGPEEVNRLDLHPLGLILHKIVDTEGNGIVVVSGTMESIRGWAIIEGYEIRPHQ